MFPKDQTKTIKKARIIIATTEPATPRESLLLEMLDNLLTVIADKNLEIERLKNQTEHWRSEKQESDKQQKELRKAVRDAEKTCDVLRKNEAARMREQEKRMREQKKEEMQAYKAETDGKTEAEIAALEAQYAEKLSSLKKELHDAQEDIKQKKKCITDLEGTVSLLSGRSRKDSHNSSKPSSTNGFTKVPNNRKPTGRKPGGQWFHPSTKKELGEPDIVIVLDDSEFRSNPDRYKDQGRKKIKQLHRLEFVVITEQVEGQVYYDRKLHREVTPDFPPGMVNETTYDSSVMAFAMLLHTWGNVSYEKTRWFLSCVSHGKLQIAKATLNSYEKRFSLKTKEKRDRITEELLSKPYLHVDGTPVRVNGKLMCVLAIAHPEGTQYIFSEHKGNEAAEKAPLKEYEGTLIHDGEVTFFKYGGSHQCCNAHEIRYVLFISENEPETTWARDMVALLQGMIHAANEALEKGHEKLEPGQAEQFREEYDKLIARGRKEYEEHPEIAKYSEGPAILNRLEKNKEYLTYYLDHLEIPTTNNLCESELRKIKMSRKQNGGFRSMKNAEYYTDTMSVLETTRQKGGNLLEEIQSTFETGTVSALKELREIK